MKKRFFDRNQETKSDEEIFRDPKSKKNFTIHVVNKSLLIIDARLVSAPPKPVPTGNVCV